MRADHARGDHVAGGHGGAIDHLIHRHERGKGLGIAEPVLHGDQPGIRPDDRCCCLQRGLGGPGLGKDNDDIGNAGITRCFGINHHRIDARLDAVTMQDQTICANGVAVRLVADQQGDIMPGLGKRAAKIRAKRPDTDKHDPHDGPPSRGIVSHAVLIGKMKAGQAIFFRSHLHEYLVNLGDLDAAVADDRAGLRQLDGLVDALGMDDGVA